jgi:hypothetical protein
MEKYATSTRSSNQIEQLNSNTHVKSIYSSMLYKLLLLHGIMYRSSLYPNFNYIQDIHGKNKKIERVELRSEKNTIFFQTGANYLFICTPLLTLGYVLQNVT